MFTWELSKDKEFALNHLLAAILFFIFYIYFKSAGLFPQIYNTVILLIIVDFAFGFLFLLKVFGIHTERVYAMSAIIESGIWLLYPLEANLSAHSCMCYMGAVIVLCFHLQLTKEKYVYYYFFSVFVAMIYLGDIEFALFVLGHSLIACIMTLEIIRYRKVSKSINIENEELRAKLHNKNYFSHHLFNPLTIVKGMVGTKSLSEAKVKESILRCLDRMNSVISQFNYSEEHVVNRGGDEEIKDKRNKSITFNIKITVFILFFLYAMNLSYQLSQGGLTQDKIPIVGVLIVSALFFFLVDKSKTKEGILNYLSYFLLVYQILMGLEYYLGDKTSYSLGLLLAGLIFAQSISMLDSIKKILLLTICSCIISAVIWDWSYIIMFMAYLIYFLKVILGSKSISLKLEESESLNKRMKIMYSEYMEKSAILIPSFNQLDKTLRDFVMNYDQVSDEQRDLIDLQVDELIAQVRSDNSKKSENS